MEPFLGEILMFAGNFAPRGWAFCDGQILPISQNQALFSLLGTTYGGDGRTTFALPELRGRVAMHPGTGPGLSSRQLGEKSGVESVTLFPPQMPNHTHAVQVGVSNTIGEEDTVSGNVIANHASSFNENPDAGHNLGGVSAQNTGGGQAHTNIQPFQCVNYIIALQGTFPSRN